MRAIVYVSMANAVVIYSYGIKSDSWSHLLARHVFMQVVQWPSLMAG